MSSQTLDVNQLNPIQQTFQGDTIDALGDAVSAWESYIQDVSTLAGTTIEDLARIQNLYLNANLNTVTTVDGTTSTIDPANPGEVSIAHALQAVRHLQSFIENHTTIVRYDWNVSEHAAILTNAGYSRPETTLGSLASERNLPAGVENTSFNETNSEVLFVQLDSNSFAAGSQGFAEQRYMLGVLSDMGIINPSQEQSIINGGNPQFRVHHDFLWSGDTASTQTQLEFHVMARDMREWQSMNGPVAHAQTTGVAAAGLNNYQHISYGEVSQPTRDFFNALISGGDITSSMLQQSLNDQTMPRSPVLTNGGGFTSFTMPTQAGERNDTGWVTIGPNNFEISGVQINRVSGAVASRVTEISAGAILTATNKVTISGSLVDAHMQVIKQQANQVKKGAEALK